MGWTERIVEPCGTPAASSSEGMRRVKVKRMSTNAKPAPSAQRMLGASEASAKK